MKQLITVFALFCTGLSGATITAASLSRDDVNTALQSAASGDTVVLPAGSATWTSGITWTAPAGVTVQGGGTSAIGGGDQTVIIDSYDSALPLINIAIASTGLFRLTGITFQSGTITTYKDDGTVNLNGPGNIRIDHTHFNLTSGYNYKFLRIGVGVFGVLDSSIIDYNGLNSIYVYNGRDNGTGGSQGNYEWSIPTQRGSEFSFFIEENLLRGSAGGWIVYSSRVFDGFTGARVTVRFNTVESAVLSEVHATGHSGDDRGPRLIEIYGNSVTSAGTFQETTDNPAPNFCAVDISSGTSLVWGNSWNNVYKNGYKILVTRYAGQSGGGTYNQSATPSGWGYAGTTFNGTGSNWDGGTLNGTDTVYGYPAIDQPGRGQGDLLTGSFPTKVNSTTGTIRWPNQALEPIYLWNNAGNIVSGWGGSSYQVDGNRIVENRDYYKPASGVQTSPTSPFDGTSGTGWGTLANRPTTCTAGVGYFATDQGSWNTSTSNSYGVQMNGADGVLYVATATNTWTAYYTPYAYPHPLRTDGGGGGSTGLKIGTLSVGTLNL